MLCATQHQKELADKMDVVNKAWGEGDERGRKRKKEPPMQDKLLKNWKKMVGTPH